MFYKKFLPTPFLRPFINWFYLMEVEASPDHPFEMPATANPCCAMVFNYGDRYRITNVAYQRELLPNSFLTGISTEPYRLHFDGKSCMLGVIFRIGAFHDVFKLPEEPKALQNLRLDASLFLGQSAELFCEQLAEAESHEARIVLANEFFLRLFVKLPTGTQQVDRAVDLILQKQGRISIDELHRTLFVSPRQLRRIFLDRTGISPKYFIRIKRFGYAYLCLKAGSHTWSDLIGTNGFYDQSHLIRDFRQFSGNPPTIQLLNTSLFKATL